MRILVASVMLASLAGCASVPSNAPAGEVRTGTVGLSQNASTSNVSTPVSYSLDQVWRVLPAVYAALGIPVQLIDPKTHQVGNEGFKTRKTLGTTPLSTYIECGKTQIGENADSYDVVLTVLTSVQPGNSGGSNVVTTIEASAKPVTYSQEYSRCSSKGRLEAQLVDSLMARLRR
jgi:hypothetical protein